MTVLNSCCFHPSPYLLEDVRNGSDGPVCAGGDDTEGREQDVVHHTRVPFQSQELISRLEVEDTGGVIERGRSQEDAMVVKREVMNRSLMARKSSKLTSVLRVKSSQTSTANEKRRQHAGST